jgi:hypothetical protein
LLENQCCDQFSTYFDAIFCRPELLLKTLDHYCEYRKTPNGIVLTPTQLGKWLIMFCDEINLPDMDKYGTQVSRGVLGCGKNAQSENM